MGDFVYQGEHSITFNPDGKAINTWKDLHMAPKSRPFVTAPPVKTEFVDVPGADGSLDYTDVLAGRPRYGRRTGSWEFIIDNGYQNWTDFYSKILTTFHGKYFDKIRLDDDPNYIYKGRLSVTGQFGNKDYSGVVISYNLDPYKYPIDFETAGNWLWNDLFGNTIYFGKFTVNGYNLKSLINDDESPVTATLEATNAIKMYNFNNYNDNASDRAHGISSVNSLVKGGADRNQSRVRCLLNSEFSSSFCPVAWVGTNPTTITLQPEGNLLYFVGNGIVTVSYKKGKTL